MLSHRTPLWAFSGRVKLLGFRYNAVAWASSLSAIHKGLQRASRTSVGSSSSPRRGRDRDGPAGGGVGPRRPSRSSQLEPSGSSALARRGQSWDRPSRDGPDDGPPPRRAAAPRWEGRGSSRRAEEESAARPKPKSRAARFHDPADSFGKRSIVYQLKHGALQDGLARDSAGRDRRGDGPGDLLGRRRRREPVGSDDFLPGSRHGARARAEQAQEFERREVDEEEDYGQEGDGRRPRRREQHQQDRRGPPPPPATAPSPGFASPGGRVAPAATPYSTAASQFLYGKSVVSAALTLGRRRLYRLYAYGGPETDASGYREGSPFRNLARDPLVELAKARGVRVTLLRGPQGHALVDRLSGGRPHNGYVLEASPLPQPPVAALGPYISREAVVVAGRGGEGGEPESGESERQQQQQQPVQSGGFFVSLSHQSAEDAAVNGTETFYPVVNPTPTTTAAAAAAATTAHRHPLVLALDHVVDPANLGSLVRTACFLGCAAVAVSRHGSAAVTPVALKASAGAAEEVPVFAVDDMAAFLARSRAEGGWTVWAAVAPPKEGERRRMAREAKEGEGTEKKKHWTTAELAAGGGRDPLAEAPCVLLMGSEGQGLSKALRRLADFEVSVPNRSRSRLVDSLNVGVAGGLVLEAFLGPRTGAVGEATVAVAEGSDWKADLVDVEAGEAEEEQK